MIFKDAIRAAHRSDIWKHQTGAAIYDSQGNLLAIGWSHRRRNLTTTPFSMHAEHHALSRLAPNDVPASIVVATITKAGALTCGKPCKSCAALISKRGIKEVFATQRLQTNHKE